MEDYKNKYEDLLDIIKDLYPNMTEYQQEKLQGVCPELAESEDEKIRKGMLEAFKRSDLEVWSDAELPIKDIIIWLEKQGEQKPVDTTELEMKRHNEGYVKGVHDAYDNVNQAKSILNQLRKERPKQEQKKTAMEAWKEMRLEVYAQASGNRHEPNCSDDNSKIFSINDIDEIFEKISDCVVEQKPIESNEVFNDFVRWFVNERTKNYTLIPSDEDVQKWGNMILKHARKVLNNKQKPIEMVNDEDYGVDGLYAALDILKTTLGQVQGYQTDDGILEHKAAITVVKKLYEQKYVKWSEEDTLHLNNAILSAEKEWGIESYTAKWLKDLSNRFAIQSKQEWSEEYKEKINQIKTQITLCNGFNRENRDKIFVLLDSLYPQSHWKPSAEQIEELHKAILYFRYSDSTPNDRENLLEQLLEDLKKL